jgi:hypothetical protein
MANAKISALADIVTLAAGDKVPVADASDLTATKSATMTEVQTFVKNLAAGTATAGTAPLKFQSGTLNTTAEDGAIEMDADCLYGTVDAGNRGVIGLRHVIRADTTRTFTSNTTEQAIFTTPANGRLTLGTGTYTFEGLLAFTAMSATSGNLAFDLQGTGGATLGSILYRTVGSDNTSGAAAAALGGTWSVTAQTGASTATPATGTALNILVTGSFEVTVAGTIQPSITMLTASASILSIGSYLSFERIGSTSLTSVGQWD